VKTKGSPNPPPSKKCVLKAERISNLKNAQRGSETVGGKAVGQHQNPVAVKSLRTFREGGLGSSSFLKREKVKGGVLAG